MSPANPLRRRTIAALLPIAAVLAAAPGARAATITSTNWSGYAVHQAGTKFRTATATWRQPSASCQAETSSDSSFWVGLGGYRKTSDALEQLGTELDCNADGQATASAWYELVPADSHAIKMTIAAGDRISASVTVENSRVTLKMADLTTGASFTRTVTDRTLDVTSAEWIAEAPSDCSTSTKCTILPLADFGTAVFLRAGATSTTGVTSSLALSPWNETEISLGPKGSAKATAEAADVSSDATATPSDFTNTSGGFDVTYASAATSAAGGGGHSGGPGGPPNITDNTDNHPGEAHDRL